MNAEQETAKSIALATAIVTACDTQSCHQEQQHQNPGAVIVYIDKENHEDDGKGIGISMFILLLVGLVFNVINPGVSFVCIIATIVLASILVGGCCCAQGYQLRPNVKRYAKYLLVTVCLAIPVGFAAIILLVVAASEGTEESTAGAISVMVLGIILNIIAIIFSALIVWGRGCGSQHSKQVTAVGSTDI